MPEQTQILGTILAEMPLVLYTIDTDGTITRAQGDTAAQTGRVPRGLVGESVSAVLADDIADRYADALDSEESTAVVPMRSNVYRTWVHPLADDGRVTGVVVLSVDITDQRERRRELKRQNEQLEEFANVVSHDLRNPLQVARGHLDEAERTGDAEAFATTRQAHDRMGTIIEDVLTLARQGQTVSKTHTVDLGSIARDAWKTVDTDHLTLSVIGDTTVEAAPARLQQLFENLFRNAVEHGAATPDSQAEPETDTTSECEVTVTIGPIEPLATRRITNGTVSGFYVEDDGPGIPVEERDDVLESGYSTQSDGTGFGLAIVKKIADVHGWETTVTEGHDGGARFEFTSRSTALDR